MECNFQEYYSVTIQFQKRQGIPGIYNLNMSSIQWLWDVEMKNKILLVVNNELKNIKVNLESSLPATADLRFRDHPTVYQLYQVTAQHFYV